MECLRAENIPRAPEIVVDTVNLNKTLGPSSGDIDIHVRLNCGKLAYVG
jgi:hypothetical protein